MAEVYKFPIPLGGKKIIFNINEKQKEAPKFLFAKFSKKFSTIEMLKCESYDVKSDVSESSFDTFLQACQGKPFFINSENVFHLYQLSKEFDTPSISKEIETFYQNNDLENLVRDALKIENPDENLELINSVASHFNELLNFDSFLDIDPNVIRIILENPNQKIINHTNLFYFAKKYQVKCNEKNKDSSFIFKYINLNQLSMKDIYEFASLEKCSDELLSKNVLQVIKKMCESLQQQETLITDFNSTALKLSQKINETESKLKKSNELKEKLIKMNEEYSKRYEKCLSIQKENETLKDRIKQDNFLYADKNPLKGIFYYIKNNSPVNDYTDQLEIITPKQPSLEFSAKNLLENSLNFLPLSYYLKVDRAEDNWIIFHLKKQKAHLYGFTIRTNELGSTIAHPKKFEILASNDNQNYELLYTFEDTEQILYAEGKTQFFVIPENNNNDNDNNNDKKFYSYIKYRQISGHHPYYDNDRIIALSAFEIFGSLLPDN